jgi:hypothetical protein
MKLPGCLLALLTVITFTLSPARGAEVEWAPEVYMDDQLYPSLLIATASVRPVEDEDTEGEEPDPYLLGERFGPFGVSIKAPSANAKVKVTVKGNDVVTASSWSGNLAEAGHDYYIAPKVNFKFDKLRAVRQRIPLNVDFELEVDGKVVGDKTETIQLHSINDCPYGVSGSEETVDDENAESGSSDLGFMFAAYVNENHPYIDKLLKEALETEIVDNFAGYQAEEPADVLKQVFAIWTTIQKRGIKYSSITDVPGGSHVVNSQYVRFLDQSIKNTQANCVDGSVLFASILKKIGLHPFLVLVPGHMYLGVYLDNDGEDFVGVETTMIGGSPADDDEELEGVPEVIDQLAEDLDDEVTDGHAWKSFAGAVKKATDDLEENGEKMDEGDPEYQMIDIQEARDEGIMPISYAGN